MADVVPRLPGLVETERLRLRMWRDDDLDALAVVFAHEEVWRFPDGRGWTRDETAGFLARQQQAWEEDGFGLWGAELRGSGELVGYVGLSVPRFLPEILPAVEVGWRLHPSHWGQGFASEGGSAALRLGFEHLGLERIVSIAEPANERSVAVMRRLGMDEWRRTTHPRLGVPLVVHVARFAPSMVNTS